VTFSAPVKAELAMPLLRLFQDKLIRVPAIDAVREDLHKIRKIVTAANNIRLDATRDDGGHADRFWSLALAYHAADESKSPLPAPLEKKPFGW
jgi:phage FluMu gp28-like protein